MYAKDTFKHQGLRKQLIDIIREMGISDETILSAFYEIPRHLFLDAVFEKQAYSNVAFQIGAGQTISHPYTSEGYEKNCRSCNKCFWPKSK